MRDCQLDFLTAENAVKHCLSIRLASDGLSFVCRSVSGDDEFSYGKIDFDASKPYIAALKDAFFEHEWLTYPFKKVSVLQVTNQYMLVPEAFYAEKMNHELMNFAFCEPQSMILADKISSSSICMLFGMEAEAYEFCSRSMLKPTFHHHLTPMMNYWNTNKSISLETRLYVCCRRRNIDIILYKDGVIMYAKSFPVEQSDDAVYYILYVWKQLGLDQKNDHLRFVGEEIYVDSLSDEVKRYIKRVSVQDIPTEALLLGGEVLKSSFDLICMSLCE